MSFNHDAFIVSVWFIPFYCLNNCKLKINFRISVSECTIPFSNFRDKIHSCKYCFLTSLYMVNTADWKFFNLEIYFFFFFGMIGKTAWVYVREYSWLLSNKYIYLSRKLVFSCYSTYWALYWMYCPRSKEEHSVEWLKHDVVTSFSLTT